MQFLFLLTSLLSVVTSILAVPNPLPGSDNIVVRDPTIWYNPSSSKYFVFSTGGGIRIFTSPSLTGPWTQVGTVMPTGCSKINHPGNCELWAPSISFTLGKYVLYYAASTIGSQDSVIGVATSPSMEPGTWTDLAAVVSSKSGDVFNAIDPDLIDYNGLKLSFGSYWNGIYQIGIWPDVNNPASATPGTHLAGGNGRPSEGGITFKPDNSPFWFHMFSDGVTPLTGSSSRPPAGQEYKVLVGRGDGGMGPFFDQSGHDLTETRNPPTGSLVLGSHDNVYAPGGQSVFKDPVSGRYVMVYHYVRNNEVGGQSYLGINFLDFSSGWPVVVN
ncbi:glycoside hydrolase family 43 protein [Marasmius fiardii PR-910]|nr:glycoside hydrolase family 43 protein [Marasmius fiardii PR-910]